MDFLHFQAVVEPIMEIRVHFASILVRFDPPNALKSLPNFQNFDFPNVCSRRCSDSRACRVSFIVS